MTRLERATATSRFELAAAFDDAAVTLTEEVLVLAAAVAASPSTPLR
jgi:hypothetical protein